VTALSDRYRRTRELASENVLSPDNKLAARTPILWLVASVFFAPPLLAHHGAVTNGALYLTDEFIELEGEITEVFWRNPHARARISVVDDDGERTIWELELGPGPRGFEARGLVADDFVGRVRVAGYRSKRNPDSLGVLHVLLPGGQEYAQGNREPRWADTRVANAVREIDPAKVAEARRTANGVFRVWSRRLGGRPQPADYGHLLSERGRELFAEFNAATDNPELECRTGMATSMLDPVPMEIIDEGDHITIHLEEYDIRRTVYLDPDRSGVEPQGSPLGYSVGRWEGDTLVVTTTHIDWPYLDPYGTPQSADVQYLERFELSDDQTMLNYSLTATDPVMFTAPIIMERQRRWTPGVEIPPFNCVAEWERATD